MGAWRRGQWLKQRIAILLASFETTKDLPGSYNGMQIGRGCQQTHPFLHSILPLILPSIRTAFVAYLLPVSPLLNPLRIIYLVQSPNTHTYIHSANSTRDNTSNSLFFQSTHYQTKPKHNYRTHVVIFFQISCGIFGVNHM